MNLEPVSVPTRPRVALLVAGFPSPDAPSNGMFSLRAARALREVVEITVIHLRSWLPGRAMVAESCYEGVPVVTLAVPQLLISQLVRSDSLDLKIYNAAGWPFVRQLLRNCDLIHSVAVHFSGVLGSRWARRAGIHHVTQVVGSDIDLIASRIRRKPTAGWENHLHGVACNCDAMASAFSQLYPGCGNIQTIYRGVDLNVFRADGATAGPLADKPPVRFLYLGGFTKYRYLPHGDNTKGGLTLLRAWQEAEDELARLQAALLLAGPDSNQDRVLRWQQTLRHPERVHIAGSLGPELVPAYLRSADVVLVPSMQEGLPNVALEVSACGRCVFGSKVDGIPEVIVHGETGLLLPGGDAKAWKEALISAAAQHPRLVSMGIQARRRMELKFDCRNYAPQMLELYTTALRQPLSAICEPAYHEPPARGIGMTTSSTEITRIQTTYAKRFAKRRPFTYYDASHVVMNQEMERDFVSLLRECELVPLRGKKLLDVGTAGGFFLRALLKYGIPTSNLFGVDIWHGRMTEGLVPSLGLACADGRALPFADATFDIVVQTTMFSSVTDATLRTRIATEMLRVLKPNGAILSYDFRFKRVGDKDVCPMTARELRRLFAGHDIVLITTGFPPPLAEILAPRSQALCQVVSALWPIATHYWAAIRKSPCVA